MKHFEHNEIVFIVFGDRTNLGQNFVLLDHIMELGKLFSTSIDQLSAEKLRGCSVVALFRSHWSGVQNFSSSGAEFEA